SLPNTHYSQTLQSFPTRRSSDLKPQDKAEQAALHSKLVAGLDKVANLDDDRIIRRYMEMIEATLRTNFYQTTDQGEYKPYISLRSEEHTSELQSRFDLVCRLLLE